MYACAYARDFATQASLRLRPELRERAVVLMDGTPPLEYVFATNPMARQLGLARGMSRLHAESFDRAVLLARSQADEMAAHQMLLQCAGAFSPRVEAPVGDPYSVEVGGTVVLDITGTRSLFGEPEHLAAALRTRAGGHGLEVQAAVSVNFHAAVCVARGRSGVTFVPPGQEAEVLAPLPLVVLDITPETVTTFETWGIRTCAELAALPERGLIARLGDEGRRLHALARGEYPHLMVPVEPDFAAGLVEEVKLDYPLDQLEPLQFLFARMLEVLLQRAREHALALSALHIRLDLDAGEKGRRPKPFLRTIRPALASRDARMLLKLVQLDIETHPPGTAVTGIQLRAEVGRPPTAQHGLFRTQAPEPGKVEVLLARLRKLLGPERVGTPQLLDTHRFDGFRMAAFAPSVSAGACGSALPSRRNPTTALRICRPPLDIVVLLKDRCPDIVVIDKERYSVAAHAGPWRKSGQWWSHEAWSREEWDILLAGSGTETICRIGRDAASDVWYLQGVYD